MPSLSLEDQLSVLQGDPVSDYTFTQGRNVDIWLAPLEVSQTKPSIQKLYLVTEIQLGDTIMYVRFDAAPIGSTQTLYRNDVIVFRGNKYIVRTTTTVLAQTQHPSNKTAVPIFAAQFITLGLGGSIQPSHQFYNTMIPFLSAKEGAFTKASANFVERHNRLTGLYSESQKVREDYTANITGDLNYRDPCLEMFEDMKYSGLGKLFVQCRYTVAYSVGGSFYGEGVLGEQYSGDATLTMSDSEAGLVSVSLEIKVSGKREKYIVLPSTELT